MSASLHTSQTTDPSEVWVGVCVYLSRPLTRPAGDVITRNQGVNPIVVATVRDEEQATKPDRGNTTEPDWRGGGAPEAGSEAAAPVFEFDVNDPTAVLHVEVKDHEVTRR